MEKLYELTEYVGAAIVSTFEYITLKTIASTAYISYVFVFGPSQKSAHLAVLLLIIADFFTGLAAAKVSHEEIRSAKVVRTAVKALIYFVMIAAAHLAEVAAPFIGIIDETVIMFLAVTELVSILENAGKMGFAIPQKLLNKLQELKDSK